MKKIIFHPDGTMHAVYDERLLHGHLGQAVRIRRASVVEPKVPVPWWRWRVWWRLRKIPVGQWYADLALVGGPVLGPYAKRSAALDAELAWLVQYWRPESDDR